MPDDSYRYSFWCFLPSARGLTPRLAVEVDLLLDAWRGSVVPDLHAASPRSRKWYLAKSKIRGIRPGVVPSRPLATLISIGSSSLLLEVARSSRSSSNTASGV